MSEGTFSRRQFLYGAAATASLAAALPVQAEPLKEEPALHIHFEDPDGNPLPARKISSLMARDLHNDPLPQKITHTRGEARVELAGEPMQISCRLAVPGFGEVFCYADNEGTGYTKPQTINFVVEAAKTRVHRVREALHGAGHAAKGDPDFERHLAAAEFPFPGRVGRAVAMAAYQSLARGLHAGERLTMLAAQTRIARLPHPRKNFLFGAAVAGRQLSPDFSKYFTQLFNFGTVNWYYWGPEKPVSAQIDYIRMEESTQWCEAHHIIPKGFGYCYLTKGAMPEWLRSYPYRNMLPVYNRVVEQTLRRYSKRWPFVEVMNEAHDFSNLPGFNHGQLLEMAREVCAAARRGSPTVKRQLNNCCLWAENARRRNEDGSRRWSPYRFLADCVKSNVHFERIGLQLYYPQQDLFEIERMLDRFRDFKRPLHISEISCNSAPGLDAQSMRPKDDVAGWHGPWTETMQADWAESIYTICYSKPEFEAVGWWDFVDYPGHFWPFGGLLRADFTPKESYYRLLALKQRWGLSS